MPKVINNSKERQLIKNQIKEYIKLHHQMIFMR